MESWCLAINHKNLDYEIETETRHLRPTWTPRRSTIRISITRLKLFIKYAVHRVNDTINHKNLDYEIETDERQADDSTQKSRSTIRISITRLKPLVNHIVHLRLVKRSTIRISITRLKLFTFVEFLSTHLPPSYLPSFPLTLLIRLIRDSDKCAFAFLFS